MYSREAFERDQCGETGARLDDERRRRAEAALGDWLVSVEAVGARVRRLKLTSGQCAQLGVAPWAPGHQATFCGIPIDIVEPLSPRGE